MASSPRFTPNPYIQRSMDLGTSFLAKALQGSPNPLPNNPYYTPGMASMVGQLGSGLMSRRATTRGKNIENRQKMAQQMLGAALDPYADFMPPTPVSQPEQVSPIRGLLRKAMPQQKTDAEIYKGLKGLGTGEIGVIAGANPFDIQEYRRAGPPKITTVNDTDNRVIFGIEKNTGEKVWELRYDNIGELPAFMTSNKEFVLSPDLVSDIENTTGLWKRVPGLWNKVASGIQLPEGARSDFGEKISSSINNLATLQRPLLEILVNNSRFPVAEMKIVEDLIPSGNQTFESPKVLVEQYERLLNFAVTQRMLKVVQKRASTTTDTQRAELDEHIQSYTNAINILTGSQELQNISQDPIMQKFNNMSTDELTNVDLRGLSDAEMDAYIAVAKKRLDE